MLCNERVSSWVHNFYLPSPDSIPTGPSSKRKRTMSAPPTEAPSRSYGSDSPKRRRTNNADELEPEQGASQVHIAEPFVLTDRTTLSSHTSHPSSRSPKRSSGSTRETSVLLRNAWPPVLTESLNGLKERPPTRVQELGHRLAEGIHVGFIPKALQNTIRDDPEIGYQITNDADFDSADSRSEQELLGLWTNVKDIFLNARDCKTCNRDENAWCDDVVRPLVHLAMDLHGKGKWWFQNIQSQSIDPTYLSTVPNSTAADRSRRKVVDRKSDYALSFSHRHPQIQEIYNCLEAADKREIGHTVDTFTKSTALFSGFEVKTASGDHIEAELQMSIWMSASLRRKRKLAADARVSVEPSAMVEPAFTIVGHEHFVYYAYPQDNLVHGRDGVHVLGPDRDRFGGLGTDSVRGIFGLLKLYGNMLEYGMEEGEQGYWGRFLGPVLHSLTGASLESAISPWPASIE